jgi:hypothetical protein
MYHVSIGNQEPVGESRTEGFESILETGSCAKPQEYCVVF